MRYNLHLYLTLSIKRNTLIDQQLIALLQSLHSRGVPVQEPPKLSGKQLPWILPDLKGPTHFTWHPPLLVQEYLQLLLSPELPALPELPELPELQELDGLLLPPSEQDLTLLQSLHSGGVPVQEPPKLSGKQEPESLPGLEAPMYFTVQPPLDWQL